MRRREVSKFLFFQLRRSCWFSKTQKQNEREPQRAVIFENFISDNFLARWLEEEGKVKDKNKNYLQPSSSAMLKTTNACIV